MAEGRSSVSFQDVSQTNSKEAEVSSISMDSSISIMNQEYETQFFNFTPKSFSDGMYNATLEFTWDCVDGARQYITTQFPELVSEEDGNRASETLLPKLTGAIDKAFDKFESYILTNIFEIPKNVVLPEDQLHMGKQYTKEQEQQLDAELQQLTEEIKCAKFMNSYLRQEIMQLDQVQKTYDTCLNMQEKTEKTCFDIGLSDLKEAVMFNNDRAVKIQNIMEKLKPLEPNVMVKRDGSPVSVEKECTDHLQLKKRKI